MSRHVGKKPARSASPLVRQLFDAIDASGMSYYDIWDRSGVHAVTLSYWKHGKNQPRWVDFENVAQVVGMKIVLVPADAGVSFCDKCSASAEQ